MGSWGRLGGDLGPSLPTPVFLGFPCGSAGKESACNVGDLGSIPGLGKSPEKGKATHSSILAWRIPWTKSMGSQRVQHDLATFTMLPWQLHSHRGTQDPLEAALLGGPTVSGDEAGWLQWQP